MQRHSEHDRIQPLRPSGIDEEDIRSECITITRAIAEYRSMVDWFKRFMDIIAKEGVPRFWEGPPWSARIHKELADDYDELMRLVKDLRKTTPVRFKGSLPDDRRLTSFPRASLLS